MSIGIGDRTRTHGMRKRPEYMVWSGMKTRCYNKNRACYADYGARGITVCARWKDSFPAFLEDMGARPSDKHTIERINNDGNYEPGNCKWLLKAEQTNNTRRNNKLTLNGETKTLSQWEAHLGITRETIRARLKKGWTPEQALTHRKWEKMI